MIRVRHYTRVNAMRKIMDQMVIIARDQNRVFCEPARSRRLSAADAEATYGLEDGCANAYIEFDAAEERVMSRWNSRFRVTEWYVVGDVDLTSANAVPFVNR